eukprot:447146_1
MAEQMNHFENNRCHTPFTQCIHSTRIKLILERYNNIISDKTDKSDQQLQNEVNDMINNIIPADVSYSNVQLINDFYHIKYDHNINDDLNQLCSFHKYLFDNEDVLKCDISYCESAKRYYDGRNRSYNSSKDNTNLLHLICRIHTYLIHAFETDRLTTDEIRYIEAKLHEFKDEDKDIVNDKKLQMVTKITNNKKQRTSSIGCNCLSDNAKYITHCDQPVLNCIDILAVLKHNNISINESDFINACESYDYQKQQLIDDLCDIMLNGEDENIQLTQILSKEYDRQRIYDTILYKYIKHENLNNENFIKVLRKTVYELKLKTIDCDQVESIARNAKLSGNTFIKNSSQFKNSVKFAQVFKSMVNWKKKQWLKIYIKINKWGQMPKQHKNVNKILIAESKTEIYNMMEHTCNIDYIDKQTDIHLIDEFCAITNSKNEIAISYLKTTEWNVLFAINKYYATNGKLSKTEIETTEIESKHIIYNLGISFWYWNNQKSNKRYVLKTFHNLKNEILNFNKFTIKLWNNLVLECNQLIKADRVREISCNGYNTNIYEMEKGASITLDHILSIKLYTDYTKLCNIFCQAFRLKKISQTQYERVSSLQRRNEKIANWAKLLMQSVQCFGS